MPTLELLTEISWWIGVRLTEPPNDLQVPALLDGDRLLEALEQVAPTFASARARNEESIFKLLALREEELSPFPSSERRRSWLLAERRLIIAATLLELAPLVRVHALRLAVRSPEDARWTLLLVAANARDARDALELELQPLLQAGTRILPEGVEQALQSPDGSVNHIDN